MREIDQLNQITDEMVVLITEAVTTKTRENLIQVFNQKLDQRDQLIKQLQPPYSDSDKKMLADLLEKDKVISERLGSVFGDLKNEIRHAKKQKNSNKQYLDPYRQVATLDGSYLDKKK